MIVGDADIEVAVDVGEAPGDVVQAPFGVWQRVLQLGERADVRVGAGQGLAAKPLGKDMAADVEVVIFGISGVGVGYEMTAERHVDADIARPLVSRRPIIQ